MIVAVRAEWDMGHRLPNHDGQCRRLHGHRYVAEVEVSGVVSRDEGSPVEGMVADFSDVKVVVRAEVAKLDHVFLLCERDELADRMTGLPGVVLVPFVPTAENIANALLGALRKRLSDAAYGVTCVRLYETPTSWAEAR